jgi:hypothetical protein
MVLFQTSVWKFQMMFTGRFAPLPVALQSLRRRGMQSVTTKIALSVFSAVPWRRVTTPLPAVRGGGVGGHIMMHASSVRSPAAQVKYQQLWL